MTINELLGLALEHLHQARQAKLLSDQRFHAWMAKMDLRDIVDMIDDALADSHPLTS
jgi:hypothetical protein